MTVWLPEQWYVSDQYLKVGFLRERFKKTDFSSTSPRLICTNFESRNPEHNRNLQENLLTVFGNSVFSEQCNGGMREKL